MVNGGVVGTARPDRVRRSGTRFWYGVADNLFRRWPLYVVPLLLVVALGVQKALGITGQYRSVGVLNVASNPLLNDITPLGNNANRSMFETPSAATTRSINELFRTDKFVRSVAERAGLGTAIGSGLVTLDQIRRRVGAGSNGDRLLAVVAYWTDPLTASQLVDATIAEYTGHVLELEVKQSTEAEAFWTDLKSTYAESQSDAEKALRAYVVQYPAPKVGDRPTEQVLELQNLNANVTQAQAQLVTAENKIEEARLAIQQATGQIGQGLQIVDPPEAATAPEPVRKKQALTGAVFVFLGLLISSALLLLLTVLDRAVRTPADVSAASGLTVVVTVPRIAALKTSRGSKRGHDGPLAASA